MSPRVVSATEWVTARKGLLEAEEQAAKALTNVSERRRELPAPWRRRPALRHRPVPGPDPLGRQDEDVESRHHDKYR